MDPRLLYTSSVVSIVGAVSLWMILGSGRTSIKALGGVIGLGVFGWFVSNAGLAIIGEEVAPDAFFLIFSLIAIASAVRVISHPVPVYSALYFVMVVISSAALILLLEAEFIAFALIIVYAGAILITYMFVLMLAQQSSDPENPSGRAEYDVNSREPGAAAVVGFIMLALLSHMVYGGMNQLPPAPTPEEIAKQSWQKLDELPLRRDEVLAKVAPGASLQISEKEASVKFHEDGRPYFVVLPPDTNQTIEVELADEYLPSNVELVGLDLIAKFPVSLELAGIILLMAMFGAVILARRQMELAEDELREAAGMPKIGFETYEPNGLGGRGNPGGGQTP